MIRLCQIALMLLISISGFSQGFANEECFKLSDGYLITISSSDSIQDYRAISYDVVYSTNSVNSKNINSINDFILDDSIELVNMSFYMQRSLLNVKTILDSINVYDVYYSSNPIEVRNMKDGILRVYKVLLVFYTESMTLREYVKYTMSSTSRSYLYRMNSIDEKLMNQQVTVIYPVLIF